jgi:NAD(P)-dependent dehydrogenase (short-subunit alcohol dehydrogenase family)
MTSSRFALDSLVVAVTGGSGLFGLPISEAIAEAGGRVIIASRNLDQNQRHAEALRARGLDVCAELLDLGQEESIRNFHSRVQRRFSGIDVLINNAVLRPMSDFWSSNASQWEESMRINVTGTHFLTQVTAEHMLQRKTGNIINISSIYGVVGPTFPIYKGTKIMCPPDYAVHRAGIISYTRYLATLLAPHVRVNSLTLGGLRNDAEEEQFVSQYAKHCPLGRKAEPEDVKGPIIFLASKASQYMTGHNLVVDGGWTAW